MSDRITAYIEIGLNTAAGHRGPGRTLLRSPRRPCDVCLLAAGRFRVVHDRVRRHRRDGVPAHRLEHHDTMVCCGACGLALVLACEAAGLEACGSPAFCQAVGVFLRTPPVVAWDMAPAAKVAP